MKVLRILLLVAGIFFTAVGLINFGVGTWFYFSNSGFVQRAVAVGGTVMALQKGSSDGSTYAPVVQFTDANGQAHTFTSHLSSSPPAYSVGQSVQVLYEPGHPEGAVIQSFLSLWFLPLLFFGIGIIPLLFGLCCLLGAWLAKRALRKQAAV